jgi:hypothetical protein
MEELITPSRIPRPRIQARAIYRKWRRQEVGATEATEFAELTDEESGVGGDARFVDIVSVHRRPPGPVRVFDMGITIICIGTALHLEGSNAAVSMTSY